MRNLMSVAWKIAKKAAVKFGGSPVEYISESLKMAWKLCGKNIHPKSQKARLTIAAGSRNHKSWVAKITGTHAQYKFDRKFVDSVDNNWTERYYDLAAGYYEVCDAGERYFIRVTGGKIMNISEEKVTGAVV